MKYIRKIAAGSLIAALAFFAGSFCLHPMSAQAMETSPVMPSVSPVGGDMTGGQDMSDGTSSFQESDAPISVLNLCVIDCASQTPQAVAAKKFSVDSGAIFLADISESRESRFLGSSSGPTDFSGTHPPAPDILSSVFKKE